MPRVYPLAPLALVFAAGTALAQPLYSVSFNGQVHTLNTTTGAATLVGGSGFTRYNAAAMSPAGDIFASRFRDSTVATDTHMLIRINPATGVGTMVADWGTTIDIRGLAFVGSTLYGIRDGSPDTLVTIDTTTGVPTTIGSLSNAS